MCGIVGAVTSRNVTNILIEGLKRLEYRGYDSAGVALINHENILQVSKTEGKVQALADLIKENPVSGHLGIAHTRWATHGKPSTINAHPHCSHGKIALVHNGIIENYKELRAQLTEQGYEFLSESDTEVLPHLIYREVSAGKSLFDAVQAVIPTLEGAYGIAVISTDEPDKLVVARSGSPLLIGLGIDENFIASDFLALRQVTDRFMYLEEGDIAEITPESVLIKNHGEIVERAINQVSDKQVDSDKGEFKHYMLKEIYEQPLVIKETLSAYIQEGEILKGAFSEIDEALLSECQAVTIIACGTSFHAGLVAKYWIEEFVKMPCQVEIASEFRYRKVVVPKNSLLITISQSGETADTLAALRYGKSLGFKKSLAICNVEHSSLVRESDLFLLTYAGREIGVASTKAFTTQLTLLLMLTGFLAHKKGEVIDTTQWHEILLSLPTYMEELLELAKGIEATSEAFQDKFHALFLGRGAMYPIAMEGALKLKEISYIHAESYAAGELKHGPLALVDATMPVVAIAPTDELLEKLKSNLEEVQARGGHLFVFTDSESFVASKSTTLIKMPKVPSLLAPIVYTLPLQLLSYYVALLKGTDVDQPRNLAKSVTVE